MEDLKLQLHLGCGKRYIPGFVHIDIRKFDHVDIVASVEKLDMFEDNSVDLIYSSHVLEHFYRTKTESVLKEWHRILKPGGVLRLAVPDFESIVDVYNKTRDIGALIGLLYGGQDTEFNFHHMTFDATSLYNLLKKVGFVYIHGYDWRRTIHKDYDDYSQAYIPHMDKENGLLMSLNVEALKGGV